MKKPKIDFIKDAKALTAWSQKQSLFSALEDLIAKHGVSALVYELANAIWADADMTQDKSARHKKQKAAYVLTNALHRL